MKSLCFAFMCFLITPCIVGAFNKGGRTSFQFTKIGIGARQTSMGEACIAAVIDVNGMFWNPACITGIETFEASFNYNQWIADLNYYSVVAGVRWPRIGVFGISLSSLDYGDIPEALISTEGEASDTRTGKMFSGNDALVGVSYAREFTNRLSLGMTIKYLSETLFKYKVETFTFDVGTYYKIGERGIRLAMSAQNFAFGGVKWLGDKSDREEGYDIPLVYRIGTAINIIHPGEGFINLHAPHQLQFSFDALHTNDYGERYHIGGEYLFQNFLALRSGYKFNYEEGNFSFGFGLNLEVLGSRLIVDYAYVGYEFLNSPQRLTISFSF